MPSSGNTISRVTLGLEFMKKEIKSSDFTYPLPQARIAIHPLEQRDQSKLLMFSSGEIAHHHFYELPQLIPSNATLFFNNTKVIPARLIFHKSTGAQIEVFLLQPANGDLPVQLAMQSKHQVQWVCTIGNLKRWKEGTAIHLKDDHIALQATLINKVNGLVEFSWQPESLSFANVVNQLGNTPLPPYLHRQAINEDRIRYQTVYSHHEGAVAAPTAGLHFTETVLDQIKAIKIHSEFLTLHVSAGTFQPIKTENALDHPMHSEQIIITKSNIESLLVPNKKVIAVGTTSMRSLESLYWYGVKLLKSGSTAFIIHQNDPYELEAGKLPTLNESLQRILLEMGTDKLLIGHSSIYIVPGYTFRVCEGLITNFHQPGSTLMLLVAAFVGPSWKTIYNEALDNDYRFLSYGDSSLLIPHH